MDQQTLDPKLVDRNSLHEGAMMIHGNGIGTISCDMIRNRASELAVIDGRLAQDASKADWDEAEQELKNGGTSDPVQDFLESVPESARWDPVPGTAGQQAFVDFNDNEDEDGRGVAERLVQAGLAEAAHDQQLEAARRAAAENAK